MTNTKAHRSPPTTTPAETRSTDLTIKPVRGRPMAITYNNGNTERGQLVEAVETGLELCRHRDAKMVRAQWSEVEKLRYLDEDAEGAQDMQRFLAALKKRDTTRVSLPTVDHWRPLTRGECPELRPCPYLACRYHLYFDVNPKTGEIRVPYPSLDPSQLEPSCALDVADKGGATLEAVGAALNLTRERIRQIETRALEKLRRHKRQLPSP